jgi:hypothetical protein
MAGSEDLEGYRRAGIHALQTTPPISRSGNLLGMVSTHWREAHEPVAREFRLRDVSGRLAADFDRAEHRVLTANFEAAFSPWSRAATR